MVTVERILIKISKFLRSRLIVQRRRYIWETSLLRIVQNVMVRATTHTTEGNVTNVMGLAKLKLMKMKEESIK